MILEVSYFMILETEQFREIKILIRISAADLKTPNIVQGFVVVVVKKSIFDIFKAKRRNSSLLTSLCHGKQKSRKGKQRMNQKNGILFHDS